VKIHWNVQFGTSISLQEAWSSALDLNPTASFLLNVLDVWSSLTDNLGAQVESIHWFDVDVDLLFWPFALHIVSKTTLTVGIRLTRPNSSRSTFSGSLRRKRRSSMRFGKSCFIISSISATAASRPSLLVLVIWRYRGGFYSCKPCFYPTVIHTYSCCRHSFIWVVSSTSCDIFERISNCLNVRIVWIDAYRRQSCLWSVVTILVSSCKWIIAEAVSV